MRIKDALEAGFRKKEESALVPLTTVWSEAADDGKEIPLPEYPRPQMRRNSWHCLNGWWEYAVTGRKQFFEKAGGRILVPFSPECARSGAGHVLTSDEALWYRKVIRLPEAPGPGHLLLHFGAVDERCTVWLNRKRLGRHRGGYLPFTFDLTGFARKGENELLVRVLDDTDKGAACRGKQKMARGGMFYTPQSGIWQSVWLEWVPEHYIEELTVLPLPDLTGAEIRIRMNAPEGGQLEIGRPRLFTEGEAAFSPDDCLLVRPLAKTVFDGSGRCGLRIPVPEVQKWSPETPFLYPVRLCLGADEVRGYFALRTFGCGEDGEGRPCLTLNGEPYFFHGVLDQGYWPESLMTAPSDEAMVFDIRSMKETGFNMLRKHVKIEPLRWYYHCDRLGMTVWQDMVNGGGRIPAFLCTYLPTGVPAAGKLVSDRHYRLLSRTDRKERLRYEQQLLAMVRHLQGVPCIGMWVIFNEGWGQFDAERLAEAVRAADPARPVDHASGWFDQGAGDIAGEHNYFRKLRAKKDRRGRPFVISEYGGITCAVPEHLAAKATYGYRTSEPEHFAEEFHALMEEILSLREQGLAGAVYTQVSDIEEEINGLLTYDRKIKKA